jgi:hypothetical protein
MAASCRLYANELALSCAFEVEITELYANTPLGKGAAEPSAAQKFQLHSSQTASPVGESDVPHHSAF